MPRGSVCGLCLLLWAASCAGPAANERPGPSEPEPVRKSKPAQGQAEGWGEDLLAAPEARSAPAKGGSDSPSAEEDEDWEQELRPEPSPPPAPRKAAGPAPAQSGPAPQATATAEEPRREPAPEAEPVFGVWAGGGVQVLRGMRVQPAAAVALDVRLGRWTGWRGLFVAARLDNVFGSTPLGSRYVMWDALLSGGGRFGAGFFRLVPEIGLGARFLTITKAAGGATEDPRAGFGFAATLGAEFRLARWLWLGVRAGGRYLQDPLSHSFGLSGAFDAGAWWVF